MLNYRSDIDGLRAVAVIAVLGFHAFPEQAKGGFIGVDIFFVISGYLISSIIFAEVEAGKFSLRSFYSRRIQRIFPALLLVLISTLLFGWFTLFQHEYKQLSAHAAGGIGFVANLLLWNETGYFDNASELKPLLHLWSLGIEEQFYIFWPVLIGLGWKFRCNFLTVTIFITVGSFFLNLYTLKYGTLDSAFYLPQNRVWELMIGGLLAYILMKKPNIICQSRRVANAISGLGLMTIIIGFVFISEEKLFPGYWAALPCLGSFLIILAPASDLNRLVLSRKWMVYVGLISYPLYLWHWPCISFLHIFQVSSPMTNFCALMLSVFLSIVTYECIEKAVRRNRSSQMAIGLFGIGLMLFVIAYLGWSRALIKVRNNTPLTHKLSRAVGDWEFPRGLTPFTIDGKQFFIKQGGAEKVLFFGDSHIRQYSPRIVKLIEENPRSARTAILATRGGCPPIPGVFEDRHPQLTLQYDQLIKNYALSPEIDFVVIGAMWNYLIPNENPLGEQRYYFMKNGKRVYFNEGGIELAYSSLEKFIRDLAMVKPVYLLLDNPNGPQFDPQAMLSRTRISGASEKSERMIEPRKIDIDVRQRLMEIANRSGAKIIDPFVHFLQDGKVKTTLEDGTPIYKDTNHIRPFYVRKYIKYLDHLLVP